MPNTQPDQGHGRGDSEFPTPEPVVQQTAAPGQPTLQEFLTRLVGNPETRSAFDADPQGTLEGAGLGGLNAAQMLYASSFMLDYAPAEFVTEHARTAQPSIDTFTASTQHVAISQLDPGQNNEQQEATETMSVDNSPSAEYSSEGDVDNQLEQNQQQSQETNVDVDGSVEHTDSHNLLNVHDVLSGNEVNAANNAVGVVGNSVDVAGNTVDNSVDTVGDTVNNTVDGALGTVNGTVDTGVDVAVGSVGTTLNAAGDVTGGLDDTVGDVTGAVSNVTADVPVAGDVTGDLHAGLSGESSAEGSADSGLVGDVTGDLPLDLL
ncbi:hypothetical protein [Actinopolyspora mortivallis]|uniref:Uncharacterized protein n=1 Tax=Actinopolyspora mortivallis TaxID=33906 RepID=A0A2T0GWH3_ACTMO|nr:hypothetical protein [Actinopolyspora mortivallis]PRW63373.1 hypothetical protein CEP50_10485 [Actinopolyspora mortivallis]